MNSLLQTLFMTPEFRAALYKWNYKDSDTEQSSDNIPYQLQKLFCLLQVSTRSAVETTSLPSISWGSEKMSKKRDAVRSTSSKPPV